MFIFGAFPSPVPTGRTPFFGLKFNPVWWGGLMLVLIGSPAGIHATTTWVADHGFSPQFADLRARVMTLGQQSTGKLIVGGDFDRFNGRDATNLLRVDAAGRVDATFVPPHLNQTVTEVVVLADDRLLVAGQFDRVDRNPSVGLIKLNADGSRVTSFVPPEFSGQINALIVQPDGRILVGGNFSISGEPTGKNLVRLESTGALDREFLSASPPDGVVNALQLMADGTLYIGGAFSTIWGAEQSGLVRITPEGEVDDTFDSTWDQDVFAFLVRSNGDILVAPRNVSIHQPMVRSLSPSGTLLSAIVTARNGVGGVDRFIETADGRVFAGGSFDYLNTGSDNGLIEIDAHGRQANTFQVGHPSHRYVRAMLLTAEDQLVWGGDELINNPRPDGLVMAWVDLQQGGREDEASRIKASKSGLVNSFALTEGGGAIAVGVFHEVNATTMSQLARVTASGKLDPAFSNRYEGGLLSEVKACGDGTFLVLGSGMAYAGRTGLGLLRISATGEFLNTFVGPDGSNAYTAVALDAVNAHVVTLPSVGFSENNLVRRFTMEGTWVRDESVDRDWRSTVLRVLIDDVGGTVVAGRFTLSEIGAPRGLARLTTTGEIDSTFNAAEAFYQVAGDVVPAPGGGYYVGGDGLLVKAQLGSTGQVARVDAEGVIDVTFMPEVASRLGMVKAIAPLPEGQVLLGGAPLFNSAYDNPLFIVDAQGAEVTTAGLAEISAGEVTATQARPERAAIWLAGRRFHVPGGDHHGMMRLMGSSYSNDNYESAQVIDWRAGVTTVDNRTATTDDDRPPITDGSGRSVWYRIEPQSTGVLRIRFEDLPDDTVPVIRLLSEADGTDHAIESLGGGVYQWPVTLDSPLILGVDTEGPGSVFRLSWSTLSLPAVSHQSTFTPVKRTGESMAFYTNVTGEDLSYQWRHDGHAIAGAVEPTLLLSSLALRDAGFYELVVSNAAGEVVSGKRRLLVYPPQIPGRLELDPTWSARLETDEGAIAAVAPTSGGGLVAAGYFKRVNGHATRGVVRYTATGSVDVTFASALTMGGDIFEVRELSDGKILVAGNLQVDGQPALFVRFLSNGTRDVTFERPEFFTHSCYRIGVDATGRIYGVGSLAAGQFDSPLKLFRFHPDGSWDETYRPDLPTGSVSATALAVNPDGQVRLGVSITANGSSKTQVLDVAPDGAVAETPWVDLADLVEIGELLIDGGGNVLVVGLPTSRSTLAWRRVDSEGVVDDTFSGEGGAGASNVRAVVASDGGILITNGVGVFRINAGGTFLSEPVARSAAAPIKGIARDERGGVVFGAGNWAGPRIAGDLRRVDASYAKDASVSASMTRDGHAHDLVIEPDGSVVLVGDFERVNGLPRSRLAKLNPDGSVSAAFANTALDGTARLLRRLPNGQLLVSGDFSTVGGVARNGLARLEGDGTLDPTFTPPGLWINFGDFATTAMMLPLSDGRLLIGGRFSAHYTSDYRQRLYRLNRDGSIDPTFAPILASGSTDISGAVETVGGDVLVGGGAFNEAGGANVVRIRPDGTRVTAYHPASAGLQNIMGLALNSYEELWLLGNPLIGRLSSDGATNHLSDNAPRLTGSMILSQGDYDLYPQRDGSLIILGGDGVSDHHGNTGSPAAHLYSGGTFDATFRIVDLKQRVTASAELDSGGFVLATGGEVRRTRDLTGPRPSGEPGSTLARSGEIVVLEAMIDGNLLQYQWFKDSTLLPGEEQPWLILPDVATADQGRYTVRAVNPRGAAWGGPTVVELVDTATGLAGTHQIKAVARTDGLPESLLITNHVMVRGEANEVRWSVLLPEGWALFDGSAPDAFSSPRDGSTDVATWTWHHVTSAVKTFSYRLKPTGAWAVNPRLIAMMEADTATGSLEKMVQPDPLALRRGFFHDADTNGDRRLSLSELLRVIELYNGRVGSFRLGGYKTDTTQPDGFSADPQVVSNSVFANTLDHYHAADFNRDAQISLSELLRVIELYNTRAGSTRTGAYRPAANTADGFEPEE